MDCAGASNGGLLVPALCLKKSNPFVPCKAAFRPPRDTAGEGTVLKQCTGELQPLVVLDVPMWRMGHLSARFGAISGLRIFRKTMIPQFPTNYSNTRYAKSYL